MDLAYDHIAEQTYGERTKTPVPERSSQSADSAAESTSITASPPRQNLQTEFQDTFKAFSNSAWGTRLGGFWGNVKKQGESYYEEAVKEVGDLGADALKEFEGLRNKVVNVSVGRPRSETIKAIEELQSDSTEVTANAEAATLEENETFINRFKTEAAKRLKEVQKAEDAADDALLRFGTNLRNFLRDAVAVSAPEPSSSHPGASTEVLFESKDAATGKKVAHASRFDAQLYVIHTSLSSFTKDPDEEGDQWEEFKNNFDIEKKTEVIASDLDKYKELRGTMETLVPEQVEYKDFWTRYYFLRHVIETQEEKRREILKASTTSAKEEEDFDWGDDDDEEDSTSVSALRPSKDTSDSSRSDRRDSTTTLQQPTITATPTTITDDHSHNQPAEPRRSHDEKSVADSDASYDLVSGTTSRAPGSPQVATKGKRDEESDEEEDWE